MCYVVTKTRSFFYFFLKSEGDVSGSLWNWGDVSICASVPMCLWASLLFHTVAKTKLYKLNKCQAHLESRDFYLFILRAIPPLSLSLYLCLSSSVSLPLVWLALPLLCFTRWLEWVHQGWRWCLASLLRGIFLFIREAKNGSQRGAVPVPNPPTHPLPQIDKGERKRERERENAPFI